MEDLNQSVIRTDQAEKVTGQAQYMGDLRRDNMLFARTLRSSRPRARLRSIRTPRLPAGYFIVDYQDVPGRNRVRQILDDQPFFAESAVNYIGEPILLVVGPDKNEILRLLQECLVEYDEIAPILSLDDAEQATSPPIYSGGRYFAQYRFGHGDTDTAFRDASLIYEDVYETGLQEQLYLEPQGMLAEYTQDRITVFGSMQCPYYVKNALIDGLGFPADRVQVVQTTVGGGFGGKEDYPSLLAGHAAFAALKTGHPVQLLLDRAEDIAVTTKRHPSRIILRTALDARHQITAMVADVRIDAGAYAGLSTVVLQRLMFHITGVYRFPGLLVHGRAVVTNTVPNGAFRGFGGPQAAFAIERHMDAIARAIGEDTLDFKLRHCVQTGDQTSTGGVFRHHVPLPELVSTVVSQSDYRRKTAAIVRTAGNGRDIETMLHRNITNGVTGTAQPSNAGRQNDSQSGAQPLRGIGMALFLHGCAFTGSGERDHIKALVRLRRRGDGKVEILTAAVEMGQGSRTALRKIVAQAMALPIGQVVCEPVDTDRMPDSGPTVASRTVIIVGKLLDEAARELKLILAGRARQDELADRPEQTPEQVMELETIEVSRRYHHPDYIQWDDRDGRFAGDAYPAYSWGVNAVEVAVDPLTLEIAVTGTWSAFDVGKAIDPRMMRGQIEGGIVQAQGYGTMEVMTCEQGQIRQRSLTDYIIPTACDCGPITSCTVDNPYEGGPWGAKGAGELPMIGVAPALAIAVGNALGIKVNRLPVTPEYLLGCL